MTRKDSIRRGDEESLYYILERDLDRGALFPENDGWESQVKTTAKHNYKIDYVLEYNKKLVGIEVKYDFPKLRDLNQVKEQYEQSLNAVFLAYPSDRVGEAIPLVESNRDYRSFGLLSLALFRSHCIRKARLRETRYDDYVWKQHFDKNDIVGYIIEKPDWYGLSKEDRRHTVIELLKGVKKSVLMKDDWRLLCLILHLWNVYGYNKYVAWEGKVGIERKYFEVFGDYPDYPTRLIYAGLVIDYSYGSRLNMVAPTDGALYHRQKIEQVLAGRHAKALYKVKRFQNKWKQHRRIGQRSGEAILFE